MQVVSLLLIGVLLGTSCYAQLKDGVYEVSSMDGEYGYVMSLKKGLFNEKSTTHFGIEEVSNGYYWFLGDTLFKYYEGQKTAQQCWIGRKEKKVDVLNNPTSDSQIDIEIINNSEGDQPMNILLRSSTNEILKTIVPDQLGRSKFTIGPFSGIDHLCFSTFSGDCIINLSSEVGVELSIKFDAKNQRTKNSSTVGVKKFVLIREGRKFLKIKSIETGESYKLNKM